MNTFYKLLENYKKFPRNRRYKKMIEASLQRRSAFAAFKRAYIRKRQREFPELLEIWDCKMFCVNGKYYGNQGEDSNDQET